MKTPVEVPVNAKRGGYMTLDEAANTLGVTKPGVRHLAVRLGLHMYRFQLDRKAYLKKEDVRKIKSLRQAARA